MFNLTEWLQYTELSADVNQERPVALRFSPPRPPPLTCRAWIAFSEVWILLVGCQVTGMSRAPFLLQQSAPASQPSSLSSLPGCGTRHCLTSVEFFFLPLKKEKKRNGNKPASHIYMEICGCYFHHAVRPDTFSLAEDGHSQNATTGKWDLTHSRGAFLLARTLRQWLIFIPATLHLPPPLL